VQANTTSSFSFPIPIAEARFWRQTKSSTTRLARKSGAGVRDSALLFVDVFQLRAWKKVDLIGLPMLAVFAAIITHPLIYGNLGNSVMALMTPVK